MKLLFVELPTSLSEVSSIAIPIILAIISNLIFANRQQDRERNPYLPPGWVIGTVWVILFGLLGYTAYLVKDNAYLVTLIALIILYCLSYPAITNFEPTTTKTRVMNSGSFLFATVLIGSLYIEKEFNAIYFAIPLWLWTSYVNVVDIVDNV